MALLCCDRGVRRQLISLTAKVIDENYGDESEGGLLLTDHGSMVGYISGFVSASQ